MSKINGHTIDLSPTVIEVEDGVLGYFYSPHQLEYIRDERIRQSKQEDIPRSSRNAESIYCFQGHQTPNRIGGQ